MSRFPKDKRWQIDYVVESGGECAPVRRTGEVDITHRAASPRRVRTSHPKRDNEAPHELSLLVKDVMKWKGI